MSIVRTHATILIVASLLMPSLVQAHQFTYYGGTIGINWAGFPDKLAPDLVSATTPYEALDVTLDVSLVWELSFLLPTTTSTLIPNGPMLLKDIPSGFDSNDFEVFVFYETPIDTEYSACPQGQRLDETTLNSDGTITVRDFNFGGIGSKTTIYLRRFDGDDETVVFLRWDIPRTHHDVALDIDVNAMPGAIVTQQVTWSFAGTEFEVFVPTKIVEWVSTDVSGTGPRAVDSGDFAAFVDEFGNPVRWGFTGDPDPSNYHVNFSSWGGSEYGIDSADLSAIIGDLGKNCYGPSKAAAEEREVLLEWFGFGLTGRHVEVAPGKSLPEYDIVNQAKFDAALQNPMGYKSSTASAMVTKVPWTTIKRLYK
jgi:hypothetical protein